VSEPESDHDFRQRVFRVASEHDRPVVVIATGGMLDLIGRKYDRFRTGVPLRGIEAKGSRPAGSKR
jgi:hypothetical protein